MALVATREASRSMWVLTRSVKHGSSLPTIAAMMPRFAGAGVLIPFQDGYIADWRSTWAEPNRVVGNGMLVLASP